MQDSESTPVFKKWKHWYILVLGFLALQILIYYYITEMYK
jgi:hypothetical protein